MGYHVIQEGIVLKNSTDSNINDTQLQMSTHLSILIEKNKTKDLSNTRNSVSLLS